MSDVIEIGPLCGAIHPNEPDRPCVKLAGHYPKRPANPADYREPKEDDWHEDARGWKWAEPDPEVPQTFP